MKDAYGRTIDYLRISLTDRCNMRCRYCMPESGVKLCSHDELLTLEEVLRLVKIMTDMGVKKVRLTGGEVFLRKNVLWLLKEINNIPGIEKLAVTTNGLLLSEMLSDITDAGVTDVNISLDSVDAGIFKRITGSDELSKVLDGIDDAYAAGLKLKINCVPLKDFNDEDLVNVAALSKDRSIDVRFIELMPFGPGRDFSGMSCDEVMEKLVGVYGISEKNCENDGINRTPGCSEPAGPARYVRFEGFKGRTGFISPLSHKFCNECNRIRLTSEGCLRLCLARPDSVELKKMLRTGMDDNDISNAIKTAVYNKPAAHMFETENKNDRFMNSIGG